MIIKCDYCGYEYKIKGDIDSETKELILKSRKIYCDRGECIGKKLKVPKGYVNRWGSIGEWNFQTEATLEEYRTLKKLQALINSLYNKDNIEA